MVFVIYYSKMFAAFSLFGNKKQSKSHNTISFICHVDYKLLSIIINNKRLSKYNLFNRCKSFQSLKRGELCRIPGSLITPGAPTQIRLPHVNVNVFRQFVSFVYTGKVNKSVNSSVPARKI